MDRLSVDVNSQPSISEVALSPRTSQPDAPRATPAGTGRRLVRKKRPRILLVNPPIFDFSAFDFWLKPYGLLRVAGFLRGQAELTLFDFLDRLKPDGGAGPSDLWGRGRFPAEEVPKPVALRDIARRFKRYGAALPGFEEFLALRSDRPFDFALVQTSMTYWYLGVAEVIDTLRRLSPTTRIVLGGNYCTLCPDHAARLGADLIIAGRELQALWDFLGLLPDPSQPPFWEGYPKIETGVLKLADGCPFRCTYCAVSRLDPRYELRPHGESRAALRLMSSLGVSRLAFYDDALLHRAEQGLGPFLEQLAGRFQLHTPNALNARLLNPDLAARMVEKGFRSFFLGVESLERTWQQKTGAKLSPEELEQAVANLQRAGAAPGSVCGYVLVGHPDNGTQSVEETIRRASGLGIRIMTAEYSPLPGTPDGEYCRRWTDLDEPLNHNKLAFTHRRLGKSRLQELKDLCTELNSRLPDPSRTAGDSAGPT